MDKKTEEILDQLYADKIYVGEAEANPLKQGLKQNVSTF